jgi:hypothetical protein
MNTDDALKLLEEGRELLGKLPPSVLKGAVDVLNALMAGEVEQAERLAKNTALAFAAIKAAETRTKLT